MFTSAACGGTCAAATRLGRLTVTTQMGRSPATGQYDALDAFGVRSFSIWTASGQPVWDSGDQLEHRTASLAMVQSNADSTADALDDRSDSEGREPDGGVLGRLGRKG